MSHPIASGSTSAPKPSKQARYGALMVCAALVVTIAGCSKSSSSGSSAAAPVNAANTVGIKLLAFTPDPFTVKAGTAVTFVNNEDITHTVTSGTYSGVDASTGLRTDQHADGKFDFHLSGKGKSGTFTFATPGTYTYYCSIHKGMNATVKVTA